MALASEVQSLLDRAAIRDVVARYFQAVDRGDLDQVRSCFTVDVHARYDGRPPVQGVDALVSSINTFRRLKLGKLKATTHFMGQLNFIALQADAAETETHAIAFLVLPGRPAEEVAVRSLRYLDKLRRVAEGWRISERLHTLDWSCRIPATFAATLAQRVTI